MKIYTQPAGRRGFLKSVAAFGTGIAGLALLPDLASAHPHAPAPHPPALTPHPHTFEDKDLSIIGPKEGYSPQIGTLVSEMAFMRWQVLNNVKGLTMEQLDWLMDDKANTIGALLFHLCATDAFYHEHTFKGVAWGKWDDAVQKKFGVAMELGDEGRKTIKGNNLDFYLNLLNETRESTLAEFRKRDDAWLMSVDKTWPWGPTNNYCKWFHVCEHESNHDGQVKLLKARLPGAKAGPTS
jgi:hypothetical protein